MANNPDVICYPLPDLPEGLEWKTLGRWIDFYNAGIPLEMDREAFLDFSRFPPQLQISVGKRGTQE
jgi:hypothetical protein